MPRTACLIVAVLVCSNAVGWAQDRIPAPTAAAADEAEKLIRMLFKDDFAKTTPKARVALAAKLFKQAEETTDDPAAQFVLWREAAEFAALGGDVDLALAAVDGLRARFTGVKAEQFETLLKSLVTRTASGDNQQTLTNYLLHLVDEAVAADDLDAAARFAKVAETSSLKARSVRLINLVSARNKEIDAFKKDADSVQAALAALQRNPRDAGASTIAGKYYCFQKGDWSRGLALLAAGDDAKLKGAAQREVGDPTDPADVLAVADAWHDLGLAASGSARRAMLAHSHATYLKIAGELAGLSRTKADKRIEELEKLIEGKGAHDELWIAVRAAIRGKSIEDLTPLGGFITRKAYRDTAPAGGILIGFRYTTKIFANSHPVMDYLQPIYLTPLGEKLGTGFGKAPAKPLTVRAKPGYAVGAMRIRGGGLLEGYGLIFMRVRGKSLDPADKYESPWLGRESRAADQPLVGDGRPVIGIHGKLRADGDEEVCSIGLIVAGAKPKK